MSFPFTSTLRALERDRRGWGLWTLAGAGLLLAAAAGGALGFEVSITAESASATLDPVAAAWVLRAPADGVIAWRRMALGQRVRQGEALAAIGDRDLAARRAAAGARRSALLAETAAVGEQRAAAALALTEERRARAAARGEGAERRRQAAAAAALAREVRERESRLAASGLLAAADAARSRSAAEQQERAAAAATLAAEEGAQQGLAALADRRAAAARLAGELARLRGELAMLGAESAAVEAELAQRTLRAPAAGILAGVAPDPAGSRVARGAPLATLIAGAPGRVEARFAPAAGGAGGGGGAGGAGPAIRPGQRAWVHLPAGPATAAAVLPAVVAAAAPALPAGRPGGAWEVVLTLRSDVPPALTRAWSGQPCQVEVELARATPAALLWRALGGQPGAAAAPPWHRRRPRHGDDRGPA
jgi:multidrug resistance efflux pump